MVMPKRREIFNSFHDRDDWFRIVNKTDDEPAEVYIYDEIGYWGTTAASFVQQLNTINNDQLLVHLSSRGGDVFDGIAIFNALRSHPATVTIQVDAMAASIASVIAQAGDRRIMLSGSQMMIHEAHGIAVGSSDELRKYADVLDKQSDIIAGIYAERSGEKQSDFRGLMSDETWMDADETVTNGLADEVVKPATNEKDTDEPDADNSADWSEFIQSTELEMEMV